MNTVDMFEWLEAVSARPAPFEFYTDADLWTDEHISKQMLAFHLQKDLDQASYNSAFIEQSVDWIRAHFKVRHGTKIADFGCGPGLYTERLARCQAGVTGIDFSSRSLQYAREVAAGEGLSINYVCENYLNFETDERYDLILMIMHDFCALSPEQRGRMLTKFHTLLEPDGAVLLEVYTDNSFEQRAEVETYGPDLLDGFWSPTRYFGFLNTLKYESEKVTLDKYTIVEADRTRTIYNWLQYFDLESLKREFADCGLEVQTSYADVAGTPFDPEGNAFAVVGRKT